LPEGVLSENVEIWFQDEARVGQRGTVTRIWARRGSRPRVLRQQQFEYAYIFGAVCAKKEEAVGLVLPTIGTFCMQKHLNEIAKHIDPGNHGVVVFDQAAWHTTSRLQLPRNLSLLPLPTASPELNPTEQVWQVLRDRYLSNRCFESYEQILASCCEAWNSFTARSGAVRQLCTREWAKN
jgi:putative transposase